MRDPIPVYIHLLRAKDVIDRDYARELDVASLAREAHASTAALRAQLQAGLRRDAS